MRLNLPATLIPPLIFWACGNSQPPVIMLDSGAHADAGAQDADGFPDAETFPDAEAPDAGTPGCTYPEGAREPMMLNEVITPYAWAEAINFEGMNVPLSLEQVNCNNDPNNDWNRFGHLLFVSLPSW